MRRLPLFLAVRTLAGCSEQPERTYIVGQLLTDEKLLSKLIGTCRNNPGKLGNTANCINAEAAHSRRRFQKMRQSLGG